MSKKSLGYVELEWNCPNCGGQNKGQSLKCGNCGAPQPEDVQFEQALQEEIVQDGALAEKAKAGADVHCAFCGTRNAAGDKACSQCGADLAEGAARSKGLVLGAHRHEAVPDVACAYCSSMNPAAAQACSQCGASLHTAPKLADEVVPAAKPGNKKIVLAVVGLLVVACIALLFMLVRTDDVVGEVVDSSWERSVIILELGDVDGEGWLDEVPEDAELGSCHEDIRYTQSEPADRAVEVCGEPYTVDTGTGVGEVVQDCEYQVYDDVCEYTAVDWLPIDTLTLSGDNLSPEWPVSQLTELQTEGETSESYEVVFSADGKQYRYQPDDAFEFAEFSTGSEWTLQVNKLDAVVSVEAR